MNQQHYKYLANFLGAYFHQDWHDEHATFEEVVRAFVAANPPQAVRLASDELRALNNDDDFRANPAQALIEIGCYFEPSYVGMTPPQWVAALSTALETAASEKKRGNGTGPEKGT